MKNEHDVKDFGAVGDGNTLDTSAIQAAIRECEKNGGGIVVLPPGNYLSGTIYLCDDLEFRILPGATLISTPDDSKFEPRENHEQMVASGDNCAILNHGLLVGKEIDNVCITGGGRLDDQRHDRGGPKPIALKECHDIVIRDITIDNSPYYALNLGNCEGALIENVRIKESNADGIVLDSCRGVQVNNCHVRSSDDALVLKGSTGFGEPITSANIVISNCDLATSCVGFKIGTESKGDFRNIVISNCVIHPLGIARAPLAGIAINSVDGGTIKGITISNVGMMGMKSPLLIRLGKRLKGNWAKEPGSVSDITINNVSAVDSHFPVVLAGLSEKKIYRISLSNVHFEFNYAHEGNFQPGEMYRENKKRAPGRMNYIEIPEQVDSYPDIRMFGDPLPAWAIFARHVADVHFSNVHCYNESDDHRASNLFLDAGEIDLAGLHYHQK
nr:glycosyl hydrolase family 28-related protein [Candidatus Sigynarchaeota archaeon]